MGRHWIVLRNLNRFLNINQLYCQIYNSVLDKRKVYIIIYTYMTYIQA